MNEKTADVPGVSWTCTGDLADAPGRASCLRGARERAAGDSGSVRRNRTGPGTGSGL